MQFSDTSTKTGLIQAYEMWTRQPDGTVSGDSTLLAQATRLINSAFEYILPSLLAYNNQIRWDDANNTDAPVGTVDLVSGQNDYKISVDGNSYDILTITHVRILTSATGTVFYDLERITSDDPRVPEIIAPSLNLTGVPVAFVQLGNTIYLNIKPGYSATGGLQIFFGRQQQYFLSSDTTKEPGIPLPFHEILALYAALDWNSVNRTDDSNLLTLLRAKIADKKKDLEDFIGLRNPSKAKLSMKPITFR